MIYTDEPSDDACACHTTSAKPQAQVKDMDETGSHCDREGDGGAVGNEGVI